MGFDMQMVQQPKSWPPEYSPQYPEDPGYFRIVTHGMPVMHDLMDEAGLLDFEVPHPDFAPFWPPRGIEQERAEEVLEHLVEGTVIEPAPSAEELELCSTLQEGMNRLLSTTSSEAGRVPAFKLASMDGWFMTPRECEIIATGLQHALAHSADALLARVMDQDMTREEVLGWVSSWAMYNRVAVENGGYRVQ